MTRILVVEDESKLASFLTRGLNAEGYNCDLAVNETELLTAIANDHYELIILDRLLVDIDTIEYIPLLRRKQKGTMVIVLTALHDIEDKVAGLRAGADDYLGKPFDFEELLARIEALLRRTASGTSGESLRKGSLKLDTESQRVWVAAVEYELTHLEFNLLKFFMQHPKSVMSRERILNKVWSSTSDPMTNIVDVYIRRLRKKLSDKTTFSDDSNEVFVETVRGSGYRLGACE